MIEILLKFYFFNRISDLNGKFRCLNESLLSLFKVERKQSLSREQSIQKRTFGLYFTYEFSFSFSRPTSRAADCQMACQMTVGSIGCHISDSFEARRCSPRTGTRFVRSDSGSSLQRGVFTRRSACGPPNWWHKRYTDTQNFVIS